MPLDPLGTKEKYKFTGEATDSDGLVFLRARYYDQTMGRFLSRDPSSTRSIYGESSYIYSADSPVQFVDHGGQWYSWAQVGKATWDTIKTLPSFAACGGGRFNLGDSCKQQGLSDLQIAIGSDVAAIALAPVTGGTSVLALKAGSVTEGLDLTLDTGSILYHSFTNQWAAARGDSEDILNTALELAIPETALWYYLHHNLLPYILNGPFGSQQPWPIDAGPGTGPPKK